MTILKKMSLARHNLLEVYFFMANAMVIGIGGVGSVIGQKLHEYDCFDRIILADMDPVFANQLAAKTPKSRFLVVRE